MTSISSLAGIASPVPSVPSPEARAPAALAARAGAAASPELREAFTQFAGQTFFGELLKQMRQTLDKPAFFHGGLGEDVFQSQLDQILVERMTEVSAPSFSGPMFELMMARR